MRRVRRWFEWHSAWSHIAAPIWLRVPERARWRIVYRLNRSRRRCWCDLVDDALCYREKDACDIHVPTLRPTGAGRCGSVCGWSHPSHVGEHACSCYCNKFQFVATEGAIERRAAS